MNLHALSGIALSVLLISISACGKQNDLPEAQVARVVNAQLHAVGYEDAVENYTTSGTFISDERVEIASRISGFIRELTVREGEIVNKGQVVVTIDPAEAQSGIEDADARLAQARRRAAEAETEYQRHKTLYEQQLVAEQIFRKFELQYQLAGEDMRVAQSVLDQARSLLEYARIKSPVAGIVVEKYKQHGDLAVPGATILAIEDPARIVLRTFINEAYIRSIKEGDEVDVYLDKQGTPFKGMVSHLVPSADPATRSYMVKIVLQDVSKVRAGMFARIEFDMGHKQVITVPAKTVVTRADLQGVYVVDGQNIAHFRMVRTGRPIGKNVEIISGLSIGDRIIVTSEAPVRTGDKVTSM